MWKKYCIATQYCRVVQATEGNTMLRKEYCALHVEQLRQETEKIRNIENLLLRNCLILSDFDQKKLLPLRSVHRKCASKEDPEQTNSVRWKYSVYMLRVRRVVNCCCYYRCCFCFCSKSVNELEYTHLKTGTYTFHNFVEWGSGGSSPLVRGSGGSCNLVKEISFHVVKVS